jgi:hypothetical protein
MKIETEIGGSIMTAILIKKNYINSYLLADWQMLNMQLNTTCHNKNHNLQ